MAGEKRVDLKIGGSGSERREEITDISPIENEEQASPTEGNGPVGAELGEEHAERKDSIADLEARIARLQEENAELREENARLTKQNERLGFFSHELLLYLDAIITHQVLLLIKNIRNAYEVILQILSNPTLDTQERIRNVINALKVDTILIQRSYGKYSENLEGFIAELKDKHREILGIPPVNPE